MYLDHKRRNNPRRLSCWETRGDDWEYPISNIDSMNIQYFWETLLVLVNRFSNSETRSLYLDHKRRNNGQRLSWWETRGDDWEYPISNIDSVNIQYLWETLLVLVNRFSNFETRSLYLDNKHRNNRRRLSSRGFQCRSEYLRWVRRAFHRPIVR